MTDVSSRRPAVALVTPVYRNRTTLQPLLTRIEAALGRPSPGVRPGSWVLHLVVDGCPDGSEVEARRLAAADPRVRVTVLPRNRGQHHALAVGLTAEDADCWVCLDADLQDPPEAVPTLLAALCPGGVAAVFAGRRGAYESATRRATGVLHRRALAAMTGLPRDAGAFVAMRARVRAAVASGVLDDGVPSIVAAAAVARGPGARLISVPVIRAARAEGTSSWRSRERVTQSARTLTWAARYRRGARRGLPT